MSQVVNNPLLKGVRGMLGGVFVLRQLYGRTIMCNRPKRVETSTPKQDQVRSRFRRATQYASERMKDPEARALYATGITPMKNNAYVVAVTDYLTPPSVDQIDCAGYSGKAGSAIIVYASDDFKVASVEVAIVNAQGSILERGEAILHEETSSWSYFSREPNDSVMGTHVVAKATDVAGNTSDREVVL